MYERFPRDCVWNSYGAVPWGNSESIEDRGVTIGKTSILQQEQGLALIFKQTLKTHEPVVGLFMPGYFPLCSPYKTLWLRPWKELPDAHTYKGFFFTFLGLIYALLKVTSLNICGSWVVNFLHSRIKISSNSLSNIYFVVWELVIWFVKRQLNSDWIWGFRFS